jgi:hypothetical protein
MTTLAGVTNICFPDETRHSAIFLRFNPFRDTVKDMCEEIADITNIPGPMKFILVLSERMEELGLEGWKQQSLMFLPEDEVHTSPLMVFSRCW